FVSPRLLRTALLPGASRHPPPGPRPRRASTPPPAPGPRPRRPRPRAPPAPRQAAPAPPAPPTHRPPPPAPDPPPAPAHRRPALAMRRMLALLLLPAFLLPAAGRAGELSIAAAANLVYALDALHAEFRQTAPDVSLTVATGASGSLVAQIGNGAPFDVFLSA